jgi:hypothetical protein
MGARMLPRRRFLRELAQLAAQPESDDWPRGLSPISVLRNP